MTLAAVVLLLVALTVMEMTWQEDSPPSEPTSAPASVRCRDARDPAVLRELPEDVVRTLYAEGSRLRGVGLGVPSLRDATWVAGEISGSSALAICGGSAPRGLYVVLQEDFPRDRCYGPSSSCPESEAVRSTCYVGLDGRTKRITLPESCPSPTSRDGS